jgi:hypothetical protein
LGERLLCKQEVIGSIPFTSTTGKAAALPGTGGTVALWHCGTGVRRSRFSVRRWRAAGLTRRRRAGPGCCLRGEEGVVNE